MKIQCKEWEEVERIEEVDQNQDKIEIDWAEKIQRIAPKVLHIMMAHQMLQILFMKIVHIPRD